MKRDGRKLAHNTLEEMRVLAVKRMSEGEHPAAVAASLSLNRSWAYKCRAAVKGSGRGLKALRSTKGTGRPRKLTPAQERQVFRWVNGKRPDPYSFDFGLWTRQIVRELVLARFGVELSLASIGALLARLGLTAQKPLHSGQGVRGQPGRQLTLHFLPGYAPDLNPDELVWSHAKRTGVARSPLKAGENLQCRVDTQLQNIANSSALVRSFFRHPSVSYITDL